MTDPKQPQDPQDPHGDDDPTLLEHHPAIEMILHNLPPATAGMLRNYMGNLLKTLLEFGRRGKAVAAQRDAMRAQRDAVLNDLLPVLAEMAEAIGHPPINEALPAQPEAQNRAQRQTEALMAALQAAARQDGQAKGGAS